jgi:hypothetical protein
VSASMVTREMRPVFAFAPVMPGRRRRFPTKRAAYQALAEQLLVRRYTAVGDGIGGYGPNGEEPPPTREWTERGAALFDDGADGQTYADRRMSQRWTRHVRAIAERLQRRDEWKAAPRG